MRSPDPISEPKASPRRVRELLANAGEDAGTRAMPDEWSVLECLAHIVDAEIVAAARYRWILAHDEPDLIGYDQDLWVDRLHDPVEDGGVLLDLLEPLRTANLDLWNRSGADQRDRVGVHRERGPESYGLLFTMIAGHDRFHLAQAERALALVRAAATTPALPAAEPSRFTPGAR